MIEVKAPNDYDIHKYTIFLGGSIDNNQARLWQKEVVEALKDLDVQILNPRRDDWDSSWGEGSEELIEQINWEMEAQELSDLLVYVFVKDSKSPITLYELGRYGLHNSCIVCVEDGFYRTTNVQLYCEDLGIDCYSSMDNFIEAIKDFVADRA